jgi:hypothetical protein
MLSLPALALPREKEQDRRADPYQGCKLPSAQALLGRCNRSLDVGQPLARVIQLPHHVF